MMLTKLLSFPRFARATGLSDAPMGAMIHEIHEKQLSTVWVGRRQPVDVPWIENWFVNPDALPASVTAHNGGGVR
jgi:hypothetical protein